MRSRAWLVPGLALVALLVTSAPAQGRDHLEAVCGFTESEINGAGRVGGICIDVANEGQPIYPCWDDIDHLVGEVVAKLLA